MRIALIKLGAFGDVVRTTSLLPGLRRLDPAMELTWVTAAAAIPLIRHHPEVRHVHTPDEAGDWRDARYDWVISLDDDRAACHLASQLRAERLSGGYAAPDGGLRYTADVEEWFGMGLLRPVEHGGLERANQLKLDNARTFGEILFDGLGLPRPVEQPAVRVPSAERQQAERIVASLVGPRGRPVVAVNTGAGSRWKYKSWGEQQTAELGQRLHDALGAIVLIAGGPEEASRSAGIVAAAGRPRVLAAPVVPDLLVFAALLGACDLLVSSDSLALHLAVSQQVPVVAFFGPTSDAEIDLFGCGEKVVTPLPCRRCYLRDCDVLPHCMQSIGADQLFDAAVRWLSRRNRTMVEG